jgi:Na+/H+ antiporter NhaD/arsenite permease-like protein
LFLPTVDSDPSRIGLEGIGASLLGTGVMDTGGRVKAVLERVETGVFLIAIGVFLAVVGVDGAGLGESDDFFWKKPRIDFWPLPD